MKRKTGIYVLAGALAMASLTGCGSSIGEDDVVATVGDVEITGDVANFFARYNQAQYEDLLCGIYGRQFVGYRGGRRPDL